MELVIVKQIRRNFSLLTSGLNLIEVLIYCFKISSQNDKLKFGQLDLAFLPLL